MARIFPKKLSRVRYIGYFLCLILAIGGFAAIFPSLIVNKNLVSSLSLGLSGFKIFVLDIPRIRSIGWSPWIALLMLIPGLNVFMQILLYAIPPDFFIPSNSYSLMKDLLQSVESKKRDNRQDL